MRLILDPPAAGRWNMAVDEMLLETAGQRGEPTLRFYGWSPAALSLGYFQPHAERRALAALERLDWVRRPSGGGAIVHDREATYSLVVRPDHSLTRRGDALYRLVHDVLVELLREAGVHARVIEAFERTPPVGERFLCFQRRAVGDVLLGDHKIAGSAQRKRRGAILQHGSILLDASPAAPDLPGIETLIGRALPPELLTERFPAALAGRLGEPVHLVPLSAAERDHAARIEREMFGTPQWNERR